MKTFKSEILLITSLLVIATFSFRVNAGEEEIKVSNINNKVTFAEEEFSVGDEKVIISIIDFGRKNPFKPYTAPKGVTLKKDVDVVSLDDVPFPPPYQGELNDQVKELMASKVNGILYDPSAKSVAIVNIKGSEYMLHKGDVVHGIMIDGISENNITLKYGTNTYTVAVGEVVEGVIHRDTVERKGKVFAGSDYNLPDINLEEYIK